MGLRYNTNQPTSMSQKNELSLLQGMYFVVYISQRQGQNIHTIRKENVRARVPRLKSVSGT